jgi:hypothetical protein
MLIRGVAAVDPPQHITLEVCVALVPFLEKFDCKEITRVDLGALKDTGKVPGASLAEYLVSFPTDEGSNRRVSMGPARGVTFLSEHLFLDVSRKSSSRPFFLLLSQMF